MDFVHQQHGLDLLHITSVGLEDWSRRFKWSGAAGLSRAGGWLRRYGEMVFFGGDGLVKNRCVRFSERVLCSPCWFKGTRSLDISLSFLVGAGVR